MLRDRYLSRAGSRGRTHDLRPDAIGLSRAHLPVALLGGLR
jgi:hypothetical protein